MSGPFTYLDYNATAPVRPEVARAIDEALAIVGNPSSVHRHGRLARGLVERARESLAELVGASAQDIIFTGGGTEANNLALASLVRGARADRLIISAIEHESVSEFARAGSIPFDVAPVTSGGVVDLEQLKTMLSAHQGERMVIAIMLANNETGVVQPLSEIAELADTHNALVHCDAIQAIGKIRVSFDALGIHSMSVSAHKFGGPQGVGALVFKSELPFEKTSYGGGQELGRRAGTENLPGIAGLGRAAELAIDDRDKMQTIGRWRDDMEDALRHIAPDVQIYGVGEARLPTTSCVAAPDWPAETQVIALDLAGVSISAGSACSSGKVKASPVLQAMGADPELAACGIRVSLGWNSQEADAKRFIDVWSALYRRRFGAAGRKTA